jgi:hypothetical protein
MTTAQARMPGGDMPKSEFEDALEGISECDRKWFEAHPGRQFRIRPIDHSTEFAPGEIYYPGARTVVAQIERGVRTRWPFRQVHEALREDTDQNAAVLLSHSSFALKNGTATTVLHFVRDLQRKAQESQHA